MKFKPKKKTTTAGTPNNKKESVAPKPIKPQKQGNYRMRKLKKQPNKKATIMLIKARKHQ